jgi:hypothetical protein
MCEGVSSTLKQTIRAFLVHFNNEVFFFRVFCFVAHKLKVLRQERAFNWRNGSIGNFFFTGARLFFNSLDAAIFWFQRVAQIENVHVRNRVHTLPRLRV